MPETVIVPQEVIRELVKRTKLRGAQKRLAAAMEVHRNTISNVIARKTADKDVFEKIEKYLEGNK